MINIITCVDKKYEAYTQIMGDINPLSTPGYSSVESPDQKQKQTVT